VQAFRALVDVQAAAVEGSLEAAIARRYQLADEGPVCVDASAYPKFANIHEFGYELRLKCLVKCSLKYTHARAHTPVRTLRTVVSTQ